jgi:site-specific DNA recombinase
MSLDNTISKELGRRSALDAAKLRADRTSRIDAKKTPRRDIPIAFSYLRVSTKEQARTGGGAEGYSIPAQRDACYTKSAQLGAVIEQEYIDAGESARSADRDDLQRMLQDIKAVKPDYVIVHKIDRLARNRADDIAINLLLKKHGVTLISCTENIDDTPSGRLLYGLMAEIAQFYSGNLAQEVMKGLLRKAEEGGTPFRAPLGYTNRREARDGAEYSWVELDHERAEIIRWCLAEYATGEWSGIDLTLAAQAKGLTSRPTRSKPSQPISLTAMYHILQNPYYMGVVSYQGIHYEGKHPVLVEPDTWLAVQDVLAAHNHTGEKDRVHLHYLRSTIYCSACGARMVFSRNKGRGGSYDYFLCLKRKTKTGNCIRPAVRVERIEDGIARFYGQFQVRPEYAEQIRHAVRQQLATDQDEARRGLERATKRKQQAQDERQKLLQAHYAGAVPSDLLASEMKRLTRALAEADSEIKAGKTTNEDIETTLDNALKAASHCERAYLTAPNPIRRQINQGFFEKLWIGEDGSVERAQLTEPFAAMLTDGDTIYVVPHTVTGPMSHVVPDGPTTLDNVTDQSRPFYATTVDWDTDMMVTLRTQNTTVREQMSEDRGVKERHLVGRMQHNTNRSVIATGPVVDLRPLRPRALDHRG